MNKDQVRRFYAELWNDHNLSEMRSILHEDVSFRGSLGEQKQGHAGFASYVDRLHEALADYRCIIEELVAEGDKVFAKMTFTGIHQHAFMGYSPTGQRLSWQGAALFSFRDGLISDVWVLGDLAALEQQLQHNEPLA
ncbi:ester cyclase [Marinobacterium arenosum]|uniref:ester cyclase n=1 Tax=Marinobacterium arenosum TaxID=2862496 RepID=UPI001C96EA61|nr:ester cyclase [Marinobacterium arenosum]MBY4678734.1 ester cyclase [Marinobacterium arenosum]